MGSQCEASTKKAGNLGLFQMAWGHIKAFISIIGKGKAKGTTTTKRFLIKIVPVLISNGN